MLVQSGPLEANLDQKYYFMCVRTLNNLIYFYLSSGYFRDCCD